MRLRNTCLIRGTSTSTGGRSAAYTSCSVIESKAPWRRTIASVCSRTWLRSVIWGMNSRWRLERDALGEPELVRREPVLLLQPHDHEAADALTLPPHRLDEQRLVRDQPPQRAVESGIGLAVGGPDRLRHPPPLTGQRVQRN